MCSLGTEIGCKVKMNKDTLNERNRYCGQLLLHINNMQEMTAGDYPQSSTAQFSGLGRSEQVLMKSGLTILVFLMPPGELTHELKFSTSVTES